MIPTHIFIDGVEWSVVIADDLPDDVYGSSDIRSLTIKIAGILPDPMRWSTFWHEVLHAIWLTRDFPTKKLNDEEVATLLGPSLAAFVRDNFAVLVGSYQGVGIDPDLTAVG